MKGHPRTRLPVPQWLQVGIQDIAALVQKLLPIKRGPCTANQAPALLDFKRACRLAETRRRREHPGRIR
jgi:hypothetical protein